MCYERIRLKEESSRCLLCLEGPCSKNCSKGMDTAAILRSIRFDNLSGAVSKVEASCVDCDGDCMKACRRSQIDGAVNIPGVLKDLKAVCKPDQKVIDMPDLHITSMGVEFENPFLLSSSIVGSNYEMVARAFDQGWAGVAFKTIGMFTPQEASPRFSALGKESNPMIGFKNIEQISDHTLEENLGYIKKLKEDYPSKVIIASIMGRDAQEWRHLAELMEEAGADIIECNFSCPQMVGEGLGSDVGTNPDLVREYTAAVRRGTSLPILAKMTPNITDMTVPAKAAIEAGADGIAAINTIKSVMNIDLESFASAPSVSGKSSVGGYSGKAVKPIALRFIQDMKKDPELSGLTISGMGGIETWKDAAEFLTCGCQTIQITTAVMQYGYRIIDDLIDGLRRYMSRNGFTHVQEVVGLALRNIVPCENLDRKTIEYPRIRHENCVKCGRCFVSCEDGGHQAIVMHPKTGYPTLDPRKCVGCQLCRVVCPTGAITQGTRVVPKFHVG
ncbi:MAG: NAD-dependent dihydropyrimidine dehydrogenase subunit PreA [Candidatus Weimeria sp.]|nr:NAD-dependent dihydropyrimidine dehydrogenase subunit PreA [Candidatus Weimeria sp.]